jgi:hypothetical protein
MDSKKEFENNLEKSNKNLVVNNMTRDLKKENQSDLKKLVTKVDERVKTKVI